MYSVALDVWKERTGTCAPFSIDADSMAFYSSPQPVQPRDKIPELSCRNRGATCRRAFAQRMRDCMFCLEAESMHVPTV